MTQFAEFDLEGVHPLHAYPNGNSPQTPALKVNAHFTGRSLDVSEHVGFDDGSNARGAAGGPTPGS